MVLNIGFYMQCAGMGFVFGDNVFFPGVENRKLVDIRQSHMDKDAVGPEIVYSIAMDIGRKTDKEDLVKRNLLFGACILSKGRIGNQPVYSQGHTHSVSKSCGCSTPELYEILAGKAIVCMQEPNQRGNGIFYAINASAGDKVLVPPGWPHYTINALENEYMVFGAWCVRDYGFEYDYVKEHGGLSYYPVYDENTKVYFVHNDKYEENDIIIKPPRVYKEFDIDAETDLYTQYIDNKNKFDFIADPQKTPGLWKAFLP